MYCGCTISFKREKRKLIFVVIDIIPQMVSVELNLHQIQIQFFIYLQSFLFSCFFLTSISFLQISLLKQSLEMQLSQSQHSLQQLQAQFSQEREHLGQQLQEMELEHQRREQRLQEAHCCAIQDMQEARQHDLKVTATKHNLPPVSERETPLTCMCALIFSFHLLALCYLSFYGSVPFCSTSTLILASDNTPMNHSQTI